MGPRATAQPLGVSWSRAQRVPGQARVQQQAPAAWVAKLQGRLRTSIAPRRSAHGLCTL